MSTMAFTAKDVQELRQRTGAGMMECKKALEETGGDMEKAVDFLRKKGIAKAEKRAGRAASEGRIVSLVAPDGRAAALIELNCETDFVARNEDFGALANAVAQQVLADATLDGVVKVATEGALLGAKWAGNPSLTVEEAIKEASARTGENLVLRRYARFATAGALGSYVHHNGKVAALVDIGGGTGDGAQALARTVAEHAAAGVPTVPIAVRREDVPAAFVEKERAIFVEQANHEGKPEAIAQKMVEGRVNKLYKEVTLLDQPWVRDDKKSIGQLVSEAGKAAGATYEVRRFARFQMGEE
jgi:elongation factor Ts